MLNCALCSIHGCNKEGKDTPKGCPSNDSIMTEIKEMYKDEENFTIAKQSAIVVSEGYGVMTRLEETMSFAKKCGYKNIGLAFCIGLAEESKMISKILTYNGFTVNSIICKNGKISKEFVDIKDSKVSMCNPIGQALLLNKAKTDFNIVVGLCVGHDTLFIKYSDAPLTVFAVKDRVLHHNPLEAVYQAEEKFKDKLFPEK